MLHLRIDSHSWCSDTSLRAVVVSRALTGALGRKDSRRTNGDAMAVLSQAEQAALEQLVAP